MRKLLYILLFTFLFINIIDAQDGEYLQDNTSLSDKIYAGGNMSFNIYDSWILFEAAPFVGHKVTSEFSLGTGIKYIYIGNPQLDIKQSYYGGNIFSRYKFTNNFMAHVEFEVLRVYELNPIKLNLFERTNASMFNLGAAYSSALGSNGSVQIMLLYDLINDYNSPYRSYYIFGSNGPPILYRIGFSFGF